MAISLNNGGIGSRRRGSIGALSEINVTPFVDVVLVLLIIFMLTAHVMDFGLEVDVPKVRTVKETAQDLPIVTIRKTGDIYLNEKMVNINDLKTEVPRRFGSAKAVYVKADKDCIWEPIAQVTAELGADGFQVNMVTQPEDTASRGR
ncbi:MAG TPA: biopolymer transporter ExbD [Bryobacteraceae bacterium]|nr:biopolymer transporter ExbD [Bryobacteraceae bacterium]